MTLLIISSNKLLVIDLIVHLMKVKRIKAMEIKGYTVNS